MTVEEIGWILLALAGLAGSAMWSGMETGLYCVSRVRLAVRSRGTGGVASRSRAVVHELERPDRVLATILLGNNVCNYLGTLGLTAVLEGRGLGTLSMVVLQVLVLTPLLLVFGESLPKELFRVNADALTPRLAGVLRLTRLLATYTGVLPLVTVFATFAARLAGAKTSDLSRPGREKFAELLGESVSEGAISEEQARLAERALAFGRRCVRDEMVPWSRVDAVSASWTRERVVHATARAPHTRVPVVGGAGEVVGIADRLALHVAPDAEVADVVSEPVWLDPESKLRDALSDLRAAGTPIGLVGRPGRPLGLVTVKDLIEPLTGDMRAW
ncbi:MAG: CNNM domain-containing protein [Planctomycetota bacterium]